MGDVERGWALVTGGHGTLGGAICRALQDAGYGVVAADISAEARDTLPSDVRYLPLDVRSDESVRGVVGALAARGPFTAVVNAHGVLRPTSIETLGSDAFAMTTDVNLGGVARICSEASPLMADGGAIVTLSSIAAKIGRLQQAHAYAASKAGVEALTRNLACELAPRLRINCVGIGHVGTPMLGYTRGGQAKSMLSYIPLARFARSVDVAAAVSFLLSDAAAYITGTTLMVDGGVTAR